MVALAVGADRESGSFIPWSRYAATLIIGAIATVVAARLIKPTLWRLRSPISSSLQGCQIVDQAWPMTVIMIALPVGIQTDRIILSHVTTSAGLAQYNLASQMYTPIFALVSAAGSLFGHALPHPGQEQEVAAATFTRVWSVAAFFCLCISVIAGWLANFASGGEVTLTLALLISFSAWMIIQAFQYPFGMYLTDRTGLRFQALMVTLMLDQPRGVVRRWRQSTGSPVRSSGQHSGCCVSK
jgi:O-antigen/teichoic acid export membrane protein